MDIETPMRRDIENRLRQDLSVSCDDYEIRFQIAELLDEFLVASALRLQDREIALQRDLLDGRRLEFEVASLGPIRLSDNRNHFRLMEITQSLQAGASQVGGPHEDDTEHFC